MVQPFCSGNRDGRKSMCNIIRCEEYQYVVPSLLLTNKVRADRARKSSGDEVNENEQLKNHCRSLCREEGRCDGRVGMNQGNVRT